MSNPSDTPYNPPRGCHLNGDFYQWTNGISFNVFPDNTEVSIADNWVFIQNPDGGTAANFTISRRPFQLGAIPPNIPPFDPNYFLRINNSGSGINLGANSFAVLTQSIKDVRSLTDQVKCVVEFWLRSDVFSFQIAMQIGQNFGTGGTPSPTTIIGSQAYFLNDSNWRKYTSTFYVPQLLGKIEGTNNDSSIELQLFVQAGADLGLPTQYPIGLPANNNIDVFGFRVYTVTGTTVENQDVPITLRTMTNYLSNFSVPLATATIPGIANFPTSGGLTVFGGAVSANFGTTSQTIAQGNDTRFSASVMGIRKGAGAGSSDTAAIAGTDFQSPISLTTTGTGGVATFISNILNIPQYANTTYSAGTGLTLTGTTFSVNTTQNIGALSNLTTDGFVKTSGGGGTLSIDTTLYQSALTLTTTGTSGASTLTGSTLNIPQYAGNIYTAGTGLTLTMGVFSVNASQNITTLSNLTSNGLIKTSGGAGTLGIASAGTDYQSPITLTTTGTSGASTFTSNTLNIPQYAGKGSNSDITSTTALNTITAAASTALTMSGGSTAASLVLGTGTNANAAVTAPGTGQFNVTKTGTGTVIQFSNSGVSTGFLGASTSGPSGSGIWSTGNLVFGGNATSGNLVGSAMLYSSGGFFVGASPTDPGASNIWLSGNLKFNTSTKGITGTATNDSAGAGIVGEIFSSSIPVGSAVSLTTATPANVTSLSLTAGDWDVQGNINFNSTTATTTTGNGGISTTSATVPTDGTEVYDGVMMTLLSNVDSITLPRKRISIAGTTTVYLVAQRNFSAGTITAFGSITARRVR